MASSSVSLALALPAPTRGGPPQTNTIKQIEKQPQLPEISEKKANEKRAPSYEERCQAALSFSKLKADERQSRRGTLFVPRSIKDFDDGGAFPEIHVAQYPRHMGNPHLAQKRAAAAANKRGGGGAVRGAVGSQSRSIINVEVDANGEVSYDAVVKGGTNADKTVYSRHSDLVPVSAKKDSTENADSLAMPEEEEERLTAERTRAALGSLLAQQTALDRPKGSVMMQTQTAKQREEQTQFIQYTPREDAPGYNPAAKKRVIRMVPAQVDPMMPPKHRHLKAPRGPAEDPVPVLHAPPEKLSKEERKSWDIPACISNWKNTRGYTIPLDKRLAADGRGLREHTINPNFATLSETLYVAERQAREEVRMRAQVQKKLALSERERREEELRNLANRARMERAAALASAPAPSQPNPDEEHNLQNRIDTNDDEQRDSSRRIVPADSDNESDDEAMRRETEEDVAAKQRERLRLERRRERERELRLERAGKTEGDDADGGIKKRRLESDRDVSEKIALGTHVGTGTAGDGIDQRLYNQSAGLDSGFGPDDEYNTYTKPMFDREGVTSSSIYRPTAGGTNADAETQYEELTKKGANLTSKFQPDKAFAGADGRGDDAGVSGNARTAPVQFERAT